VEQSGSSCQVHRVRAAPDDAAALLDLSTIAQLQGRPRDRIELQAAALKLLRVYRRPSIRCISCHAAKRRKTATGVEAARNRWFPLAAKASISRIIDVYQ
jgi:hypothetical protein